MCIIIVYNNCVWSPVLIISSYRDSDTRYIILSCSSLFLHITNKLGTRSQKKQDYLGIFPQIRDTVTKKRDFLGIIPTTLNIRGNPQPLSPQVPSKVRPGVFCIHTCFNAFAENLVSQDVKIDGMKGTEYIQP